MDIAVKLIDHDSRRRAAITHALSTSNVHVEPFENIPELLQSSLRTGIVLLHDDDGAVEMLVKQMARHSEWAPIIAFSDNPCARQIVEAILDGAIDYIAWPIAGDALKEALQLALDCAGRIGNARRRKVMASGRIGKLTLRERDVLSGVASGLSNRLIGERLAISTRTVENHRANMLHKLGANHTSEAIRIAIDADLIE